MSSFSFGDPDLRSRFFDRNPLPPSQQGRGLLQENFAGIPDTRAQNQLNFLPSNKYAEAPIVQPAAAPAQGSVGNPLGDMLKTAVSPLTNAVTAGGNAVQAGADNFSTGFATESSVASAAARLTNQGLADFAADNDIGIDAITNEQARVISQQAQEEAQAQGQQQNQDAFGTVVGSKLLTSGVSSLIAHQQAKDEIDAIQHATERFINGVEFNSRLTKLAGNNVEMRKRLQMMDSMLQQGSEVTTGGQQQLFLRNPNTGLQV